MDSAEIMRRCGVLAGFTEEPGRLIRNYLSPPMHDVHRTVRGWMEAAGMETRVDAAGNLRATFGEGPRLMIGSHLDTVPSGGRHDGVLGVLIGIALVARRPPCAVEVVGFSGAEGVGEGVPLIGSRAVIGEPVTEVPVLDAIRNFGLDPGRLPEAVLDPEVKGYLEFHIEQGPMLDCLGVPLAAVETVAGFSRWCLRFDGKTNHAGSTPMNRRRDALAGAAEWIGLVEHVALSAAGLVATADAIEVRPTAGMVIPGTVRVGMDVRHGLDEVRERAREVLLNGADDIAGRRGLAVEAEWNVDELSATLHSEVVEQALAAAGYPVRRLVSGGGEDAMILARRVPSSMFFLRGEEVVLAEDVDAALAAGEAFLRSWRR